MFQYISNDNLTAILNPLNYVGDVNSTNNLLVCKSWRSAIRASPWDEAAKVIQCKWRQSLCLLQRIRAVRNRMADMYHEDGTLLVSQFHQAVQWCFDTRVDDPPEAHGGFDRNDFTALLHGYHIDDDDDFEMQKLRAEAYIEDEERLQRQELIERLLPLWPKSATQVPVLFKFSLLRQIPLCIFDYYEEWVY